MQLTDSAAERAVLAGICRFNHAAFVDADSLLNTHSFVDEANQIIWKCAHKIFSENPDSTLDQPLILSAAKELGLISRLESSENIKYLRAVFNTPVELKTVGRLCAKLKKLQIARDGIVVASNIQSDLFTVRGDEPISSIVSKLETPIFDFVTSLSTDKRDETVELHEGLAEHLDWLEANPGQKLGISSGYPLFDLSIGGSMERGTVHMIFARMKQGKSMFVDNIGMYVADKLGIPILNIDTEMSQQKHWYRVLANMTSIPINTIKSGEYANDSLSLNRVRTASEKLKRVPYSYRCVKGKPFDEILSIIRRWIVKNVGIDKNTGTTANCLVIYDYFKIMGGLDRNILETQQLGFQMTSLHDFAGIMDVPILSFGQLNRDGIDSELTSAIAGSDRLAMYADSGAIFKKKTPEEIAEDGPELGNRRLIPIFARDSDMWEEGGHINYNMTGKYGRLEEINPNKSKISDEEIPQF